MMPHDLDTFHDLAWRALEAPADASLREQIAAALAEHPEWNEEWRALRETHRRAREAVPAARAREQADRDTVIPAQRLERLMKTTTRRSRFPIWRSVAACVVLAGAAAWFLVVNQGPDLTRWTARAPASLERALTAPFAQVLATTQLPTLRDASAVQLRSPLIAAQAGPVTVEWADATPLVVILRENNRTIWSSPRTTTRAITPALAADHVYELVLTPENGPVLRERFFTVPETDEKFTGLAAVFDAAVAEPARLGEAVLAWQALSPEVRRSEIALRLGLWLAVEARQPDLLKEVQTLAASPQP